MDISYVFACLMVRDRDRAVGWYERLLGRPPTFLPHEGEAVWQVAATASVYVLVDVERAGKSVVTLVIEDLDARLGEMAGRGIVPERIEVVGDAGRKAVMTDPDGNEVALVALAASS